MTTTVTTCDRCGNSEYKNTKFVRQHGSFSQAVNGIRTTAGLYDSPRIDLCDACLTKLGLFLNGIELTDDHGLLEEEIDLIADAEIA